MGKKLTGKALAKFEAKRDVWQEVLDGVREIKAGKGKRTNVEAKSYFVQKWASENNCDSFQKEIYN
jgi:putative transcriptional regulator